MLLIVYLASGALLPRPQLGLRPWNPLGEFGPQTLCAQCPPYLQTLASYVTGGD